MVLRRIESGTIAIALKDLPVEEKIPVRTADSSAEMQEVVIFFPKLNCFLSWFLPICSYFVKR